MAQSSLMYYAYFRFYVDESEIIAGMEKFCTGWEHMFAVGYNYHEYKCFVDNIGGFEHWVGDMRGYISQTRETGFMDGSPSDAVYDSSLLMGAEKLTDNDFIALNCVPIGRNIYFRKMIAQDGGMAHKIKLVCGDAIIAHPVMYTFDTNQIEILKPTVPITDSSDVDSYEYTADMPLSTLKGGVLDSITGGSVANFANIIDHDKTTYGTFTSTTTDNMIIDMGEPFSACSIYCKTRWSGNWYWTGYYASPDKTAWTSIGGTTPGAAMDFKTIGKNNLPNGCRYIKAQFSRSTTGTGYADIYRILCS